MEIGEEGKGRCFLVNSKRQVSYPSSETARNFSSCAMCCCPLRILITLQCTHTSITTYFLYWEAHKQAQLLVCKLASAKQKGVMKLPSLAGYTGYHSWVSCLPSLQRHTAHPCLLKVLVIREDSPLLFCKAVF